MTSQDESESLDFEDVVDMAFPSTDSPVEMDAFVQRLQSMSEEDFDDERVGADVNTAARVVEAIQDEFPDADVSIDRTSPDSDVTVRVVIERDEDGEDVREKVPQVVDDATDGCESTVTTDVVDAPEIGSTQSQDDTGGVIIE